LYQIAEPFTTLKPLLDAKKPNRWKVFLESISDVPLVASVTPDVPLVASDASDVPLVASVNPDVPLVASVNPDVPLVASVSIVTHTSEEGIALGAAVLAARKSMEKTTGYMETSYIMNSEEGDSPALRLAKGLAHSVPDLSLVRKRPRRMAALKARELITKLRDEAGIFEDIRQGQENHKARLNGKKFPYPKRLSAQEQTLGDIRYAH
jgi:hypothetical protein